MTFNSQCCACTVLEGRKSKSKSAKQKKKNPAKKDVATDSTKVDAKSSSPKPGKKRTIDEADRASGALACMCDVGQCWIRSKWACFARSHP